MDKSDRSLKTFKFNIKASLKAMMDSWRMDYKKIRLEDKRVLKEASVHLDRTRWVVFLMFYSCCRSSWVASFAVMALTVLSLLVLGSLTFIIFLARGGSFSWALS